MLGGSVLAGCGGEVGLGAGAIALGLLAWPFARAASAGPPMPCARPGPTHCSSTGLIRSDCCERNPDGVGCDGAEVAEFVGCGNGTCAPGRDLGRCDAPRPTIIAEAGSMAECEARYGHWQQACLDRRLTQVCVPPMPTNFTGPAFIPHARGCGGDRCTTHVLIEDCYATTEEARSFWPLGPPADGGLCLGPSGAGQWQRVCLKGAVALRCIPASPLLASRTGARAYVECADGSCAVGASPAACPAP
jgi:hypothetical protein